MPGKILVVDDEPAIRQMICLALRQADYACLEAEDVPGAQAAIKQALPDMILLDWMLPGTSGLDYARRLRRDKLTQAVPIILLTARTDEEDKVRGLDTGADDYITKPFSTRELLSRIKALLRRSAPHATDVLLQAGDLVLDPVSHRVRVGERTIELGPTEFKLLHFLMAHPERAFSRARILDGVWGNNVFIDERTVDVHIRRLRMALSDSGHEACIQTVRGTGYRFAPPAR